jgi:drug/metabolite transporter (DMT)-like permease
MVAIAAAIDPALARRRYLIGVTVITLSTIAWGAGPLFIRLLPFDMWTIVFWRGVFGAAFAGVYLIWRFGRDTGTVIRGMGMQGLWITLYCTATITVFVPAVQYTSVANAMVIYAALPFFTATIAWIWLRERPTRATLVASAVVMLGILIMVNPTTGGPRLGDLLAVIGTAAAAGRSIRLPAS